MPEVNILLGTQKPPADPLGGIRRVTGVELGTGIVHLQHLQSGTSTIFFGLAADRPTDGSVAPAYFSYDNSTLSIWAQNKWVSVVLS